MFHYGVQGSPSVSRSCYEAYGYRRVAGPSKGTSSIVIVYEVIFFFRCAPRLIAGASREVSPVKNLLIFC